MHTTTQKSAPVLCKLKNLATRMRQLFKIGKAKQAHQQKYTENNNNNNCETENDNNSNSELSNMAAELTDIMAQNAANEWLLQHAATLLHTADTYAADMESHVICLHTEVGQFYWNAPLTQANELYTYSESVWQ